MNVTPNLRALLLFLVSRVELFVTKYHKSGEISSLTIPPFSITFLFASSRFKVFRSDEK